MYIGILLPTLRTTPNLTLSYIYLGIHSEIMHRYIILNNIYLGILFPTLRTTPNLTLPYIYLGIHVYNIPRFSIATFRPNYVLNIPRYIFIRYT